MKMNANARESQTSGHTGTTSNTKSEGKPNKIKGNSGAPKTTPYKGKPSPSLVKVSPGKKLQGSICDTI